MSATFRTVLAIGLALATILTSSYILFDLYRRDSQTFLMVLASLILMVGWLLPRLNVRR